MSSFKRAITSFRSVLTSACQDVDVGESKPEGVYDGDGGGGGECDGGGEAEGEDEGEGDGALPSRQGAVEVERQAC